MKVYRLNKFDYTIDFPILFLFFGVSLDTVSTYLFIALNAGIEAHPILKELISISVWFIPFYLYITNAIFIPFLPDVLRKTLSYTVGLLSVLFALNNFSLILFKNAFIVDTIGYTLIIIIFIILGFFFLFYFIKKNKLKTQDIMQVFLKLFLYIILIGLINLIFLAIIWLPIS